MANVDKIVFNSSQMNSVSKNIQMFIKEQDYLIEDFKSIFDSLASCYKTENTSKLSDISSDLINSMNNIKKNYDNDIILFDKVKTKYSDVNDEVDKIFRNIGNKS